MGLTIPDGFDRHIGAHGNSRSLTYAEVMQGLRAQPRSEAHRPGTATHPGILEPETPVRWGMQHHRDPVTWRQPETGDSWHRMRSTYSDASGDGAEQRSGAVKRIICDFVDRIIPVERFRDELRAKGVVYTDSIVKLARRHEQGAGVTFREFGQEIFRQLAPEAGAALDEGMPIGAGDRAPGPKGRAVGQVPAWHHGDIISWDGPETRRPISSPAEPWRAHALKAPGQCHAEGRMGDLIAQQGSRPDAAKPQRKGYADPSRGSDILVWREDETYSSRHQGAGYHRSPARAPFGTDDDMGDLRRR
mmetsp:Transcript_95151/g.254319  ORF Transcript_95151/g.254319 Transcript_95151/m.254319 type:complete len:304 (-) Transcript_95151:138-1049(-)